MTPRQPKRLGFGVVAAFCAVHVLALFALVMLFETLYAFFVDYQVGDAVYPAVEIAAVWLFWSTPVWALLWAWIYVRALNALFHRQPGTRCAVCGYDLTGNVSGRCPECGREINESPLADRL